MQESSQAGRPYAAETLKDAKFALSRSIHTADPGHYVRGQCDGDLDIDGVAQASTTETYAAMRFGGWHGPSVES